MARGDVGKAMISAPSRVDGIVVTDWALSEIMAEIDERDLDPGFVTIEYQGCGSHEVIMRWEG